METMLEQLLEDYGLVALLEQNDIEELVVLEILIDKGLFNPYDYMYLDTEEEDD